ncbi:TrmH family RNA methyltransferase [Neorhizobium galegae]|uniref:TrmH family RNA methyltransferase n=1 Tax=Neorhizobium galegae TaxID=399 RepID=UPI00210709C3|nr:RNA methyltransferase [Neorhizobium galegae]MCQ1835859.1 RNA methyltransferase [Neorhizobium galegae]
MAPLRIDDADDPRIAEFRSIRERDLTGREGRFIAEGTVVLRMLAAAHGSGGDFLTEKILLLENRVAGLSDILASFPSDIPVYVASAGVLDQIAGFHLHRGVLALGRRRQERTASDLVAALPEKALVVAAFGISNHDNIGSIFRNAAAFGADAVLLDQGCCDPLYRKSLRVSVGAVLSVPYARHGTMTDILAVLMEKGFAVWGLSPTGSVEIRDVPPSERMVLITGTEGVGLPAHVLSRIRSARIAQAPGLDSLNAATATGIALYEIAMVQGRLSQGRL